MELTSGSFEQGGMIPAACTCDGGNVTPELEIRDVPEDAKSLALVLRDPDAPSGTFYHWLVWNIDPLTPRISDRSLPSGAIEGTNSAKRTGYMGPCPPGGQTHRYFFDLYALDTELDLDEHAGAQQLERHIEGHRIGRAELMGLYARQ